MDREGVVQWPWKFAQDPSGHLWIAFDYTGSEVLIGRYDPRDQHLAFINVGKDDEGVVQQRDAACAELTRGVGSG